MIPAMPKPSRTLCGALILALALPLLVAGSAAAKGPATTLARRAAPDGPLRNVGRWIVDSRGRVVILHGINMVYKRPPYQPGAVGFGADDARFLARNGFDTVRLGMIEKAIEPSPGHYRQGYITKIRSIERTLARHRIFSLIDFHQDLYNEKFGGEGWPDWAVLDDGLPADPLTGFPGSYVTSPGLNRAFDNFWANDAGPGGVGIQNRYAAAWAKVARGFGHDDGVLGYDILNEPWPGSAFSSCLTVDGCPGFDIGSLVPFYRRVVARIRRADRGHLVFYEPQVLFNFDSDTNIPRLKPKRLGFSFHDYCFPGLVAGAPTNCGDADARVFDNADAHAATAKTALLLSEFGATADIPTLERITGLADLHMVSWQEWQYCGCEDPTTSGPGDIQALVKDPAKPPRGANVFHDKLRALARPYPQAIAGTPVSFSFDPDTRRFQLLYRTGRAAGHGRFRGGLSEVFVPAVQYPRGYRVRVRGAALRRASGGRRLVLIGRPSARRIRLRIAPR